MKFTHDIKSVEVIHTLELHIPPDEVNPKSIQITNELDHLSHDTHTTTRSRFSFSIQTGRTKETIDNEGLFNPPGDVKDVHFTDDGRLLVLSDHYILYVIDTKDTENSISYDIRKIATGHDDKGYYVTSTEDGAIWIATERAYYMLKGHSAVVYSMYKARTMKDCISQWGSNYHIGFGQLYPDSFHFFYTLRCTTSHNLIATKAAGHTIRTVKWNDKLLTQNGHFSGGKLSIFLSLHKWEGGSKFSRIHSTMIESFITSINITGTRLVLMHNKTSFTILDEELKLISSSMTLDSIHSVSIHLGQIFTVVDTSKSTREGVTDMERVNSVIGSLSTSNGITDIVPTKLVLLAVSSSKLLSSNRVLYLVTKYGIHIAGVTWSKDRNRLIPAHMRKSVTTLYTLQMIGVLKVPREILESILVYAFSF